MFSEMTNEAGPGRNGARRRILNLIRCLALGVCLVAFQPSVPVEAAVPAMWDVVARNLENRSLTGRQQISEEGLGLVAGGGRNRATHVPQAGDLWVDAVDGDDGNDGLTPSTALHTIQRAADLAGPGITVHIMPGVYRETVWPAMNGSIVEPILYLAEDGPGTVTIRGSEPSGSLDWTHLEADTIGLPPGVDPTNLYYADLSLWERDGPPRFVVELDSSGEVLARLPLAREPDWQVNTEWKHHEFWWAADGGSALVSCDPTADSDCDLPQRSTMQLIDRTDDAGPSGIEPGNLTTVGDLTGGTLVAMDTNQGHYAYRRTIVAHDVSAGRVTVGEPCELGPGSGDPGLGWGSKYYVEDRPYLLDTPGEWWYDVGSGYLYLWPLTPVDPSTLNIEIARRDNGFRLEDRSYVTLDGLTIEILDEDAVDQPNGDDEKSHGNVVRNAILRYANRGIALSQNASGLPDIISDGFTVENSEIAHMDTLAIYVRYGWEGGSEPESFTYAGIINTTIQGNEMHHLGLRSDRNNAVGALFVRADRLRFEGNYVHHVAHNGVLFSRSVIQSPKEWGFSPEEIRTGEILVKDNVFERACLLTTDCGALKFWGSSPDGHVFRDVFVTGNVFRDTIGWTYVSEKRGLRLGGSDSEVQGMGGRGLYLDHASGIYVYRNIAYNNAFAGFVSYADWRDGEMIYYNNIAANSLYGFRLVGPVGDPHPSVNTQLVNNIMVNNEGYGILYSQASGPYDSTVIDRNLYHNNGWRAEEDGGMRKPGAMVVSRGSDSDEFHQTLTDIQASTPWESHGVEGDPAFWDYDLNDHDLQDGSWPDFHVTAGSTNVLDRGVAHLPASLARLLVAFDVQDIRFGSAFDIGRFEAAGASTTPTVRFIEPGESTYFWLKTYPPSFPAPLTLAAESLMPDLSLDLSSSVLDPGETVTVYVTDAHDPGTVLLPGLWYIITITATHGESAQAADVRVLVGGRREYLPLILKRAPRDW